MKKAIYIIVALALFILLLIQYLQTPRDFADVTPGQWAPKSKTYATSKSPVIPPGNQFYALHSDTHNSDEIAIAVAADLELAWTTEANMFVAEGPSQDNQGDLYFSPIGAQENSLLISIDGHTGARRWAIPSNSDQLSSGGGAPLILNEPERPGQQTIYLAVYDRAIAISQDGTLLWDVPTGLTEPRLQPESADSRHVFGVNYLPQADALVGLTADGNVFILDRKTGKPLLEKPHHIEGAPGISNTGGPSERITQKVDALMASVFGPLDHNYGRFDSVLQALFGSGLKVSNYFAIDRNTGRIFIAATAPDEVDGQADGHSSYGSLYAYDLVQDEALNYALVTINQQNFKGGTGASPAVNANGTRVYTADNDQNLLAFDRDLNPIWSINVGDNIPASISVASENNELFAISMSNIYKIKDLGDHAELVWTSNLDTFPEFGPYKNFNMTTATIAANGIAVSIGAGITDGDFTLPLQYGVGLLDRETGEVISYTPAREESVSVTVVANDGGILLANSPIRRAVSSALFGSLVQPLTGGISRFKPADPKQLAESAFCAAQQRISAATTARTPEEASAFEDHAQILIHQSNALSGGNIFNDTQCE